MANHPHRSKSDQELQLLLDLAAGALEEWQQWGASAVEYGNDGLLQAYAYLDKGDTLNGPGLVKRIRSTLNERKVQ